MKEDSQWAQACWWVQEQVLISFRHRAIVSRLNNATHAANANADRQGNDVPECMLVIELPPALRNKEPGSVAQLKEKVMARLKHLEEMESIEEQVRAQKDQRSKLSKLRRISPNLSSKSSEKRRN